MEEATKGMRGDGDEVEKYFRDVQKREGGKKEVKA